MKSDLEPLLRLKVQEIRDLIASGGVNSFNLELRVSGEDTRTDFCIDDYEDWFPSWESSDC